MKRIQETAQKAKEAKAKEAAARKADQAELVQMQKVWFEEELASGAPPRGTSGRSSAR